MYITRGDGVLIYGRWQKPGIDVIEAAGLADFYLVPVHIIGSHGNIVG